MEPERDRMTKKLLVEYQDMPAVRGIARDGARHEDRFSALVMGIVTSTPFQTSMKLQASDDAGDGQRGVR